MTELYDQNLSIPRPGPNRKQYPEDILRLDQYLPLPTVLIDLIFFYNEDSLVKVMYQHKYQMDHAYYDVFDIEIDENDIYRFPQYEHMFYRHEDLEYHIKGEYVMNQELAQVFHIDTVTTIKLYEECQKYIWNDFDSGSVDFNAGAYLYDMTHWAFSNRHYTAAQKVRVYDITMKIIEWVQDQNYKGT